MQKIQLEVNNVVTEFNASPIGIVSANLEFKKLGINPLVSYKTAMSDFFTKSSGADVQLLSEIVYALYRGASASQNKGYLEFTSTYEMDFLDNNIEHFVVNIYGQEFYDNMVKLGEDKIKNDLKQEK